MTIELYNHTTISSFNGDELMLSPFKGEELMLSLFKGNELMLSPFKGDELMRDEYCDGNHCGDPTSIITSATR